MITDRKLANLASSFLLNTGFDPKNYLASTSHSLHVRCVALRADIDWYRRHTQDIERKLRQSLIDATT